jgi:predicted RNase H-like nuclease (RuvC/YqgF family)
MADEELKVLLRNILKRLDAIEDTGKTTNSSIAELRKIVVEYGSEVAILRDRLLEHANSTGQDVRRIRQMTQEHDAEIGRIKLQLPSTSGTRPRPPRP